MRPVPTDRPQSSVPYEFGGPLIPHPAASNVIAGCGHWLGETCVGCFTCTRCGRMCRCGQAEWEDAPAAS